MRIQSQISPIVIPTSRPAQAAPAPTANPDTVVSSPSSDPGIYRPGPSRSTNAGSKMALQFAGIGVMFGGILASQALPHNLVGAGIIGSMFGGLALMALANNK